MTTLILPKENGRDSYTNINLQERVISAETAVHKASFFLAMNIGHLLRAANPKLLLDSDFLKWQMKVVLTSPLDAPPQFVGQNHLSATDGSVLSADRLIEDLTALANANYALRLKLRHNF